MLNYAESFNKGIHAAKIAQGNREEIKAVLEEFREQILSATHGKIDIRIREFYKNTMLDDLARLTMERKPRETYEAIAASNPLAIQHESKELARWTLDKAGYPCMISLGDMRYICEDAQALRNNLSLLLENPLTGEKLYELMNLPIAEDDTDAQIEDS